MKLPRTSVIMQTSNIVCLWTIITVFTTTIGSVRMQNVNKYGRDALLLLRPPLDAPPPTYLVNSLRLLENVFSNLDATQNEMPVRSKCRRSRGRRGGIRARIRRRGIRTPLPIVLFGNVNSIRNKADEFAANCKFNRDYRESAIIAITETWLQDKDSDGSVNVDGYSLIRSDRRDVDKVRGGGVAIYINEKWCKQVTVKDSFCNKDLEYLLISCRPFYLPREFCNVYIANVYIPPDADMTEANDLLLEVVNTCERENPNGINIILGDFNTCEFEDRIPVYEQSVKCATRNNNTLDKLFCNVKDSYRVIKKSPLGNSDHNMLLCAPTYIQKLKREKCKMVTVRGWSQDNELSLQGCYECTDWPVLYDNSCDINENADVLTSYVIFCFDMIVPTRIVKFYPNNKPWVKKDLKMLLDVKKNLVNIGDRIQLKAITKEIHAKIREAKIRYKERVENLFKTNKPKDAWKGLKVLCGQTTKSAKAVSENTVSYVNELNSFYARFDSNDFKVECDKSLSVARARIDAPIILSEQDVIKAMKRLKSGKASGPDNIDPKVLKLCVGQLLSPLHVLFQDSLLLCTVPDMWKIGEIIPVAKVKFPKVHNDLRPVVLTSHIMKSLEDIVRDRLCEETDQFLDPFQFAYCKGKSVQDAVLTLVHEVTKHLDKPNTQVRILFVDFSSAFNTIQPHILINKLLNMGVNSNLVCWIHSYLTNRTQYTKLNKVKSDTIVTNTGAPQGCVLSPLLFTLYTNDCTSKYESCSILKYADDTVIIGKICNNNATEYLSEVSDFVTWCKDQYLDLNVKKTKEMIIDFRNRRIVPDRIMVGSEYVERVSEYKYLGIVIDDQLKGSVNNQMVYKKCNQRLHFLRVLRNLQIDQTILTMFYRTNIESIICFALTVWYSKLNVKEKGKIKKIVKTASKLKANVVSLVEMYNKNVIQQVDKILNDATHPLHKNYVYLRSGRRLAAPAQRLERFKKTFVPNSIRIYNHMLSSK